MDGKCAYGYIDKLGKRKRAKDSWYTAMRIRAVGVNGYRKKVLLPYGFICENYNGGKYNVLFFQNYEIFSLNLFSKSLCVIPRF